MTLTSEQIEEGWKLHDGTDVCPIKDDNTRIEMMWSGGEKFISRAVGGLRWKHWFGRNNIVAYRIIEAHGADAEPARPAAKRSGRLKSICLACGMDTTTRICGCGAAPARPTPFPRDYSDLVFDADGWSQTIIVDGKRPEWLRDDDSVRRFGKGLAWGGNDEIPDDLLAIRVRRREPKRETVRCWVKVTFEGNGPYETGDATIDLIDGKPDLSTIKIEEGAL